MPVDNDEPAAAATAPDAGPSNEAALPVWQRAGWIAAGVWLALYLLVWATGQRFSTAYLDYGWQLVPWDILSKRPLQSVWFLHIQPPLWNLTLGGLARLSPFTDAITLQALQAALGAIGAACAATIARRCRLGLVASVVVAVVATANPEVLRNAFEPTYELATSTLLLALVVVLARFAADPTWRRGPVLLAAAGTAVVLTRSLYHPIWLAALLVAAFVLARRHLDRRQMLAAVAVPVLLIGGWMGKNQVLYGRPTLSSWFGMNLQRAVIPVLDADELQRMYEEGEVSDVAMIGPFGAYDLYADVMPPCAPDHDDPSVDTATRTTDEFSPNFNYECYLPVFDQAGDDAWAVISEHPGTFLEGRLWSARTIWAVALGPSQSESWAMRTLDDAYSIVRLDYRGEINNNGWGHPIYGDVAAPADFAVSQILLYAAVGVAGIWHIVRFRRRGDDVWSAVVVATAFIAAFTFVAGITFELGEQARFRTMTDPLVWTVGIAGAWNGFSHLLRARRGHEGDARTG
jgi:hypothetical protein